MEFRKTKTGFIFKENNFKSEVFPTRELRDEAAANWQQEQERVKLQHEEAYKAEKKLLEDLLK